jgi:hypothetical protein
MGARRVAIAGNDPDHIPLNITHPQIFLCQNMGARALL